MIERKESVVSLHDDVQHVVEDSGGAQRVVEMVAIPANPQLENGRPPLALEEDCDNVWTNQLEHTSDSNGAQATPS